MMRARAVRRAPDRPGHLSEHRRALATSGVVQAWVHEGPNLGHCVEVSTTGALGTCLFSRQNLEELKRMIAAADEVFAVLDERGGSPFQRPPIKLAF